MNVADFTKLDASGVLFTIVDADRTGYMTSPSVLEVADKNVVKERFGDANVIGFEPKTKRNIILYISFK